MRIDSFQHGPILDFDLMFDRIDAVLAARLPPTPGAPLRATTVTGGWLGDRSNGAISPYACFSSDRSSASWLASEETARDWQRMAKGTVIVAVVEASVKYLREDLSVRVLMKPAIALLASFIVGCGEPAAAPTGPTTPTGPNLVGNSCPVARPDFGGPATAADRNLFAYSANAPLGLQEAVESTNNGVEVRVISFESPDGGRVTGLLFDPVARSSPRPGMVLMHGMPGTARSMAAQGQLLAEHGAVAIAIDAPFARRGGQPVAFSTQDRAEQIQLIKDLQRAVDLLRARPNIDDERIAYLGVSYGGAMGALFAGVERRLKAAVLVVGDGGLVSHFTGPEDYNFMAGLSCATRVNWFDSMTPIEPVRFVGQASPTALLLQNGRFDTLVPVADAEALQAAASVPKTIRWYDAGHGLNQQAVFDRLDWLRAQIGLDAPQ